MKKTHFKSWVQTYTTLSRNNQKTKSLLCIKTMCSTYIRDKTNFSKGPSPVQRHTFANNKLKKSLTSKILGAT